MAFHDIAGAAYRALTARKDGPSLYEVCDPLLAGENVGDPHLARFYRTALGNPALRALLRRTGLAELNDAPRLQRLREALVRARDDAKPDWAAIGAPVAELLDSIEQRHPAPKPAGPPPRAPEMAEIERVIRRCGAHLLGSFARRGFIPGYAAFNLIGDVDLRGRELMMALTGLNSRGYKNSTLLFNLARVFIARSPARALIDPPWTGIAEPMRAPVQIRHRSAYYDAFFTEALLGFPRHWARIIRAGRRGAAGDFRDGGVLPFDQPRASAGRRRHKFQRGHRAGAAAASAVLARLRPDQAEPRLWRLRAGLRHHRLRLLGRDPGRLR